jgi:hypothetical protein
MGARSVEDGIGAESLPASSRARHQQIHSVGITSARVGIELVAFEVDFRPGPSITPVLLFMLHPVPRQSFVATVHGATWSRAPFLGGCLGIISKENIRPPAFPAVTQQHKSQSQRNTTWHQLSNHTQEPARSPQHPRSGVSNRPARNPKPKRSRRVLVLTS